MKRSFLFIIFFSAFFYCAHHWPNVTPPIDFNKFTGMRYIEASEKAFTQGAADRLAGSDEKPVMLSSFTYDFGIDTTEVTQKEFFDITGRRPVVDDIYGKGDAYPVYNVSWFDAILFCNAKSKFMGLDTVYEFFQVKLTASGSAYELTGLKIHYEFEGIRLPTEAEWEFVARENTSALPFPHLSNVSEAARMAWFDTTSSGKAHPVAQLEPNAFGIYDLAGNVFEWTGDWKGPYSVPSITNSIGALEPNGYYEKVIKGGAFTHGFINLRPSRRSATYPTTIGTAVRYIGFRCARGAITDVHYIAKGAASVKTNTVDLIAGDMRSLVSSPGARLVFVNVTDNIKTLCVIDYSRSHPLVHEFSDDHNVNVPVISPDGKQVVYSSHGEGFGGNAKGYIRSLDSLDAPPVPIGGDSVYTPRFWADGTFCIYTNSSIDNGTPSWPMTQTIKQKISGGKPSGLPVVLVANGSFHDGLTPDGNYCVTGFTRLIIRDLANGTDRQLFLFPFNGKDSVGSAQVCNVSISPDTVHPPQCMFLDFGSGSKTSTLTGTIYGIHEYVFISQFTGSTVKWYRCPAEEKSWNSPEWSNHPGYAVACGCNNTDESHAIYLLDLKSGASTKLVQGVVVADPYLWISNTSSISTALALDSVGYYNDPPVSISQQVLASKLRDFWLRHNDLEVVITGDSRPGYGINPHRIVSYNTFNLANPGGEDFMQTVSVIKNYVLPHCAKLKLVVADINMGAFSNSNRGVDFYSGMAQSKGYNYDKNHKFWQNGLPANFVSLVVAVPAPPPAAPWLIIDSLGNCPQKCNGWGATVTYDGALLSWDTSDTNYRNNFSIVQSLAADLAESNVHLLLVQLPMNPEYAHLPYYSDYGPSQETAREIIGQLQWMETNMPFFHFYDAHKYGTHNYTDQDALDEAHLCEQGANKLSDSLSTIIDRILAVAP